MIAVTISSFLLITCLSLVAYIAIEQDRDWRAGYVAGCLWSSLLCALILFFSALFFLVPFTDVVFETCSETNIEQLQPEEIPTITPQGGK